MSTDDKATFQSENTIKPLVLKYKKVKSKDEVGIDDNKGKERYSKGLEDIQRFEGNFVSINQKAAKALSKGLDVYEKERNKSAKEKKDGAIEDFVQNSAKASSAYMKEASDIPIDLADAVTTTSYRKHVRKYLRRTSKFLRLWRI